MTKEKTATLKKILTLDRRIFYVIIISLLITVLVYPIGLPITIDPMTRKLHNRIEELPEGSIIFINLALPPSVWAELSAMSIDVMQHVFEVEGIKFFISTFSSPDAQIVVDSMLMPNINKVDKVYGVDWVWTGFIEGVETAMTALAGDFLYTSKDFEGNMLEDFPLMKELKSMEDVDLILFLGAGPIHENTRQFVVPYNKPQIAGVMAMIIPDAQAYYEAGLLESYISGSLGAAQYESIRKRPGLAIPVQDAQSIGNLFLVVLGILVNAVYIISRRKGERI